MAGFVKRIATRLPGTSVAQPRSRHHPEVLPRAADRKTRGRQESCAGAL